MLPDAVRRFGAHEIAPQGQKVEGEYLLGHPTYLALKDKGETSMSEKRGSTKGSSVIVPASPARMAKPELVESQEKSVRTKNPRFPVAKSSVRRSYPEAATLYDTCLSHRMWNDTIVLLSMEALYSGHPIKLESHISSLPQNLASRLPYS